jgi:hypothetical protein
MKRKTGDDDVFALFSAARSLPLREVLRSDREGLTNSFILYFFFSVLCVVFARMMNRERSQELALIGEFGGFHPCLPRLFFLEKNNFNWSQTQKKSERNF